MSMSGAGCRPLQCRSAAYKRKWANGNHRLARLIPLDARAAPGPGERASGLRCQWKVEGTDAWLGLF
jgi:hypothetical protein